MRAAGIAISIVGAALLLAGTVSASRARSLNHVPPARAPCSVLSGQPCHPSFCGVFAHGPCLPYDAPTLPETLRLTIVSTDDNDPADQAAASRGEAGEARLNNEDGNWSGDAADKPREPAELSRAEPAADRELDSIRDMFEALRGCWVPPPRDAARHGMEYTIRFAFKRDGEMIAPPRMTYASHDAPAEIRDMYREAIDAALKRCTPLHFSAGMGGAVAGRPIAVRFVDERTVERDSGRN